MATAAIIVGSTIAAGATTANYFEQKKAGREMQRQQEKANSIERARAQTENARNRRKAIAQARIAQARNQAAQSGLLSGSSAYRGSQSALSSQLGANIGNQTRSIQNQFALQGINQNMANIQRDARETGAMFGAIGSIGGAISSVGSQFSSPSPTTETYQGNPVARLGSFGSTPRPGQN